MYKHFEPSEDVFVDREEHIEWMNEALQRCKKKSVVLHLRGIGGIGKSSLLNHWINTHEKTIRLDCEQYSEFYHRLNILAKGAVLQGVKLERFDILWQIRQRFVEGVEPVKEEGRQWAKEVVMAIPFIGSLASIGGAISAVGSKVTPKLKGKYGTVGKWLHETLGKNHIEQLLNILWKEPRRAEFLYLEAFLEDINNRDNIDDPILFLLDHFEYVDDAKDQWKYRGQKINETQLWTIFLCNLANCVGVLASRRSASDSKLINVEESELTELNRDSCFEMLQLQDIVDKELQEKIVSVSGGNPFVIDTICDMINTCDVSILDIESLRADTLAEVRLKVWRRLFSQAEGLHNLINRAGILPYFDERIMRIISPEMTAVGWNRLRRLSFVRVRSDGSFVLHDLAEDLVRAELGNGLGNLVDEVSDFLEKKYDDDSDIALLGISISVRALKEPRDILHDFDNEWGNLSWNGKFTEALALCNSVQFRTEEGRVCLKICKSHFLTFTDRVADGEHEIREAIDDLESISTLTELERKRYLATLKRQLAVLFIRTGRETEAIDEFEEALALAREVASEPPDHLPQGLTALELSNHLWWYGTNMNNINRLTQAEVLLSESIEKWESWANQSGEMPNHLDRRLFSYIQIDLCETWMYMGKLVEAETRCKSLLQDIQNPHLVGVCYLYLAEICLRRNKSFDALEWSNKMVEQFSQMPQNVMANLRAYLISSKCLDTLGEFSEALLKIEVGLRIARESHEKAPEAYTVMVAKFLRNHAVILNQIGKTSEAEETYNEILHLLRNLTHISSYIGVMEIVKTLNNRGVLLFRTGKISKAQRDYDESLELGREPASQFPEAVDNIKCIATILNNLGILSLSNGRTAEAKVVFEESLSLYEQLSRISVMMAQTGRASVLNNLGALLISEGEYNDAEKMLMEALGIRKELESRGLAYHKTRIGSTTNNLGLLHLKRGKHSEASDEFRKATDILEGIVLESPLDCKEELRCALSNRYIALSRIDSEKKQSAMVMKKLGEFGVKRVESESFILDVLEAE